MVSNPSDKLKMTIANRTGDSRQSAKISRHPLATALVFTNDTQQTNQDDSARIRLTNQPQPQTGWGSVSSLTSVSDNNSDKTPPPRVKPTALKQLYGRIGAALAASVGYQLALTVVAVVCGLGVVGYLLLDERLLVLRNADDVQGALYYLIMALLGAMVVDFVLKLVFWRSAIYHQRMELIDGFLLAGTITAMIVGRGQRMMEVEKSTGLEDAADSTPHSPLKYAALFVFVRCWRFERVLSGMAVNK